MAEKYTCICREQYVNQEKLKTSNSYKASQYVPVNFKSTRSQGTQDVPLVDRRLLWLWCKNNGVGEATEATAQGTESRAGPAEPSCLAQEKPPPHTASLKSHQPSIKQKATQVYGAVLQWESFRAAVPGAHSGPAWHSSVAILTNLSLLLSLPHILYWSLLFASLLAISIQKIAAKIRLVSHFFLFQSNLLCWKLSDSSQAHFSRPSQLTAVVQQEMPLVLLDCSNLLRNTHLRASVNTSPTSIWTLSTCITKSVFLYMVSKIMFIPWFERFWFNSIINKLHQKCNNYKHSP